MKKQLLRFGLMAGMGAFLLSADVKANDTLSIKTDTASFYRDTLSLKNDTASFVRDTASFVRDTALLKDTATFNIADTATFKADTAMAKDSSFALRLDAATGDTAAMKAIAKDTAAFKQDTATIVKNSISKDTTTVPPADTSTVKKPKAVKAKK
jgi:hypothetical protein